MNKIITSTIAILLITFSAHAESKGSSWKTYKKNFGTEEVSLQFPSKPKVYKEDGVFMVLNESKNYEYGMLTMDPPVSLDPHYTFDMILDIITSEGDEIEEYTIECTDEYMYMDAVSSNKKHKTTTKSRTISTENNFYMLAVTAKKGAKTEEQKFFHSFQIISK